MSQSLHDNTLDLEAMIAEFLADNSLASFELPQMTTGQRKTTKTLVGQHPKLRCESYGFGADRRLHLFKNDVEAQSNGAIRGETGARPDQDVIVNLAGGLIENWSTGEGSVPVSEPIVCGAASSEQSTAGSRAAPSTPTRSSAVGGSPDSSACEPPTLPEGVRVRNTFIDIEDAKHTDQRAVRSMPYGMFRQCLVAEAAVAAVAASAPLSCQSAAAPAATVEKAAEASVQGLTRCEEPCEESSLALGAEVVIEGLVKLPAFNGLYGVVCSFDAETSRYSVLLTTPCQSVDAGVAGQQHQHAKVRRENLRLASQAPPLPHEQLPPPPR